MVNLIGSSPNNQENVEGSLPGLSPEENKVAYQQGRKIEQQSPLNNTPSSLQKITELGIDSIRYEPVKANELVGYGNAQHIPFNLTSEDSSSSEYSEESPQYSRPAANQPIGYSKLKDFLNLTQEQESEEETLNEKLSESKPETLEQLFSLELPYFAIRELLGKEIDLGNYNIASSYYIDKINKNNSKMVRLICENQEMGIEEELRYQVLLNGNFRKLNYSQLLTTSFLLIKKIGNLKQPKPYELVIEELLVKNVGNIKAIQHISQPQPIVDDIVKVYVERFLQVHPEMRGNNFSSALQFAALWLTLKTGSDRRLFNREPFCVIGSSELILEKINKIEEAFIKGLNWDISIPEQISINYNAYLASLLKKMTFPAYQTFQHNIFTSKKAPFCQMDQKTIQAKADNYEKTFLIQKPDLQHADFLPALQFTALCMAIKSYYEYDYPHQTDEEVELDNEIFYQFLPLELLEQPDFNSKINFVKIFNQWEFILLSDS